MGLLDIFKTKNKNYKFDTLQELGGYTAYFSGFGSDLYKSETVRACVRALAEHTSKANAVISGPANQRYIADLLNYSPNMFMNGKSFLAKVRTRLELQNTCFIYINRDNKGKVLSLYPVPYASFAALEYANGIFIKFSFNNQADITLAWEDLAVLRKDYNKSDIAGDDNNAILATLELINTTNQGVANAVRATANLRGILKSTKAMLKDEDISKMKDRFVKDYLSLENSGGIAALDANTDFTPLQMSPTVTSWEQAKEFRENVYRYFGVNDNIVMSKFNEGEMEAFYEARIAPFLIDLSDELTRKVLTPREQALGCRIVYESSRIQYASAKTKLAMISLVDRGVMTPNEIRALFNLAPYDGGDNFILRLDTAPTGDSNGSGRPKEKEETEESE